MDREHVGPLPLVAVLAPVAVGGGGRFCGHRLMLLRARTYTRKLFGASYEPGVYSGLTSALNIHVERAALVCGCALAMSQRVAKFICVREWSLPEPPSRLMTPTVQTSRWE
jgi:hypothetical protein